jgi:Zn finger protein HypA/HybF involved in hydrogenase expression
MATKIPIAQKRMFHDVFVCKKCNHKVRSQAVRVVAGKVTCPKCGGHALRPIRKK